MPRGKEKLNRVGEIHTLNDGNTVIIIEYFDCSNCTIMYEDGIIRKNVKYNALKKGITEKPINRTGEKLINREGHEMEIIKWEGYKKVTVRFNDLHGAVVEKRTYQHFQSGNISNPYDRTVYGVGYLGQGEYSPQKDLISHVKWRTMMQRCYDPMWHIDRATYVNVTVCEEWESFQNFTRWFYTAYDYTTMNVKWCLDKDILIKGNKIYSPETCCFVPNCINVLFNTNSKMRGDYPVGVHKYGKKFVCCKVGKYKSTKHNTPLEAFNYYKIIKEATIQERADEWISKIKPETYEAMYRWEVEITD